MWAVELNSLVFHFFVHLSDSRSTRRFEGNEECRSLQGESARSEYGCGKHRVSAMMENEMRCLKMEVRE